MRILHMTSARNRMDIAAALFIPVLLFTGCSAGTQAEVGDQVVLDKLAELGIVRNDAERARNVALDAYKTQKRIKTCMKLAGFEYRVYLPEPTGNSQTYFGLASRRRAELTVTGGANTNTDPSYIEALVGDTVGSLSPNSCTYKASIQSSDSQLNRASKALGKQYQDPRFLELDKRWARCMGTKFGVKVEGRRAYLRALGSELGGIFDLDQINQFEEKERLAYSQYRGCLTPEDDALEERLFIEYGRKAIE
jgi:hypothetical protein